MPTFAVAPALRGTPQGQVFDSPTATFVAGWTHIDWELDIPAQADYENPAHKVSSEMFINGLSAGQTPDWVGGPASNKAGAVDPPPKRGFNISNRTVGDVMMVRTTVTAPVPFNIGVANGVVG